VVEGYSWLCGPLVPYPVHFLNQFLPSFTLAFGVDFFLPPGDDRFALWFDLRMKGTFGFSGRLLHPCNPSGDYRRFFPLGDSLTMGFLHSYHLGLFVVVFALGSPPVPILPSLVCMMAFVISPLLSMAIPGASSLMGFPQLRVRPSNHGPLVEVYLLVLFPCLGMCALKDPIVTPVPILCSTHCTNNSTTPCICTWVRCTHT
jgi:hypothetical protein